MIGRDPGECPICGAAHTACTTHTGPIAIEQLPERDASAGASELVLALRADVAQATLHPDAFTTGTYRGKKKP